MNIFELESIIITGGILLLILSLFYKNINDTKVKNNKLKLEKKKINLNLPINQENLNLLDIIINMRFQDVLANNVSLSGEKVYITGEIEKKLRNELKTKVENSMTQPIIDKLSVIYNKDAIPNIIAEKIIIAVLAFKVGKNTKSIK